MSGLVLALKAEAVLAVLLVTRHRAPRLGAALALTAVALTSRGGGSSGALFVAAGALGVVAGSRPLARGPALAAARRVPAPAWIPVLGRLLGTLAVLLPVLAVAAAVQTAAGSGAAFVTLGTRAGAHGLTAAALVMGCAPVLGATTAATLGLAVVLTGLWPSSLVGGASAAALGLLLGTGAVLRRRTR